MEIIRNENTHIYTHTYLTTIDENKVLDHNFKRAEESAHRRFEGMKRKGDNDIIIS